MMREILLVRNELSLKLLVPKYGTCNMWCPTPWYRRREHLASTEMPKLPNPHSLLAPQSSGQDVISNQARSAVSSWAGDSHT